jgi:choline dehydrogenase-like flavoprotein
MVSRIHHDRKANRVTGVSYLDQEGNEHFQKAKVVIVSGYAIETPPLLLNSACDGYENGLANSSDTVGRYLMAQAGNVILGRFEEPVRMYKAPPPTHSLKSFMKRIRSAVLRADSPSRPLGLLPSLLPSR